MDKRYYIYILASKRIGTLYTGMAYSNDQGQPQVPPQSSNALLGALSESDFCIVSYILAV